MTYAIESKRVGRTPYRFVTLSLDRCDNQFGLAPCSPPLTLASTVVSVPTALSVILAGGSAVDGEYVGLTILFLDGPAFNDRRLILAYNGTTKEITFANALTAPPVASNSISILNPPCFNTRATCQDAPNYARNATNGQIILAERQASTPRELIESANVRAVVPCVKSFSITPARLMLGKGLGSRASMQLSCADFAHNDAGLDPYLLSRGYNPLTQGTFFGKLIARNPFYLGRSATFNTGYLVNGVYDPVNFQTELFFLEKIAGIRSNNTISIIAQDLLKRLDDDKAQFPAVSIGELAAPIVSADSSMTVQSGAGAGYAVNDVVRIGEELIRIITKSGDSFTLITRGVFGSTADDHQAGDGVQKCGVFEGVNVTNVIIALALAGGIDLSNIDTVGFANEQSSLLAANALTAIISEPTGVKSLLKEISEENFLYLWWDGRAGLIKLKSVVPAIPTIEINDDSNFLADSITVFQDLTLRISEFQIRYAISDHTQYSDVNFYRKLFIRADLDSESQDRHGEPRIIKVQSRWFPAGLSGVAAQTANRTVAIFGNAPYIISFSMDAKDDIQLGDTLRFNTRHIQNFEGENKIISALIIEKMETESGTTFTYKAQSLIPASGIAVIAPSGLPDFDSASTTDKEQYAFICPASGVFADGREEYRIY